MSARHEALTKAAQTADLLRQDLVDAYRDATGADEILIWELLESATKICGRLGQLAEFASATKVGVQ